MASVPETTDRILGFPFFQRFVAVGNGRTVRKYGMVMLTIVKDQIFIRIRLQTVRFFSA